MLGRAVAFLLGVLLLESLPQLPHPVWYGLILLVLVGARWPRLVLLAWFVAGFVWAFGRASWQIQQLLPTDLEQQELFVEGVVASLPERSRDRWQFRFDVQKSWNNDQAITLPKALLLSWYRYDGVVRAGERWRLAVRLKRPWGSMNPGGFDYEAWLIQQGVGATGTVVGKVKPQRLSDWDGFYFLQALREQLRDRVRNMASATDTPVALGVFLALTIGDQASIAPEAWDVFRRTGTSHLMAISGMHISLIAGIAFFLGRRLWGCFPLLCHFLPAQKFAALAGFMVGLLYALLAGFGIPLQRALIMLAVVAWSVARDQESGMREALSWSVVLVLLYDPVAVLAPGFWLSVVAVALIAYLFQPGKKTSNWLLAFWSLQWPMFVLLLPLQVLFFHQVSLLSPLVNFVAIPLIELFLVPFSFLLLMLTQISLTLAGLGYGLWQWIFQQLWRVLQWFSELEFAVVAIPGSHAWTIAMLIAGIFWLLAPPGFPNRFLGWAMIVPLFLQTPQRPAPGDYWLRVLDVGQGLSVVVETAQHVLVYDTGGSSPSGFNFGDAVVIPYLQYRGIAHLDLLMISHGDNDHIGGMKSLLQNIAVDQVSTSVPEMIPFDSVGPCLAGTQWTWDQVHFEILHPADYGQQSENNRSCVLRIVGPGGTAILPGDLEKEGERTLLSTRREKLPADILISPHHGSKTSSTEAFLSAVHPQVAVVSSGHLNRFHHPSKIVEKRYEKRHISLLNTAEWGAVHLEVRAIGGIQKPQLEREIQRHYWHPLPQ